MTDSQVTIVRFSVPGSVASRQQVLDALATVCAQCSHRVNGGCLPDTFTHQMVSAVGEAFNNIVLHAYGNQNSKPVDVEFAADATSLTATLRDYGEAFDPQTIPDEPFPEDIPLIDLPESGMGLYIMRSCVDELVYRPGSPNALVLRKWWSPAQV